MAPWTRPVRIPLPSLHSSHRPGLNGAQRNNRPACASTALGPGRVLHTAKQLERPVTMISIVELDGTPVATASCLSAAADIMRNVYPGWYHVLESPRFLRSSDRALRRWGSA